MRYVYTLSVLVGAFVFSACSASHELNTPVAQKKFDKSLPLNYQTVFVEILQPKCANCHSSGSSSHASDMPFAPYSVMVGPDPLGRPDMMTLPANESRFYKSIAREDKHRMPPPMVSEALSAEEIAFIAQWIDAGKPEF